MKKLKLVQDELDADQVHIYAPNGKSMVYVCAIHVNTMEEIFPEKIADKFLSGEVGSFWIKKDDAWEVENAD